MNVANQESASTVGASTQTVAFDVCALRGSPCPQMVATAQVSTCT